MPPRRPATLRHRHWNYAHSGAYFVTICVRDKKCIFGEIKNSEMILSRAGQILHNEIQNTTHIRKNIKIDSFVIMPNHWHAVIFITGKNPPVGVPCHGTPTKQMHRPQWQSGCLGAVVGQIKQAATKQIRPFLPDFAWQRSFHDRVIRDPAEYDKIATYIFENPARWEADCFWKKS